MTTLFFEQDCQTEVNAGNNYPTDKLKPEFVAV